MRINAPPHSDYRLARLHRWAMLWLQWFAAFIERAAAFAPISQQVRAMVHKRLDRIERAIVAILIIHAAPLVKRIAKRGGFRPHRLVGAGFIRALLGAKLRRALRSRDLSQRIAALRQSIDSLVTQLLARIPRGLTRRRPIRARRESAAPQIISAPCTQALSVDTS